VQVTLSCMSDSVLLSKMMKKGISELKAKEILTRINPEDIKKIIAFPPLLDKLLEKETVLIK